MSDFNYSLNIASYSLKNALLWGNCIGHWNESKEVGNLNHRAVHILIAGIQSLPIIGQIASLFEMMIVTRFASPTNRLIDQWVNENGNLRKYRIAKRRIMKFITNKNKTTLKLSWLDLQNLPDIFHLPAFSRRLSKLQLNDNQLTTLPQSFCQLTALKVLHLGYNKLTVLPHSFGQLAALERLNLNQNELTTLPESFSQLKTLIVLEFSANPLKTLPESFGQLSALETIYLNGNQLTTLPPSIGQLSALNTLTVLHNKLTSVPTSIGQLRALYGRLDLSSNPSLTNIPLEILNLPRSCTIDLTRCGLTPAVKTVLRQKIEASGYRGPSLTF